jgi:hypothetical protein
MAKSQTPKVRRSWRINPVERPHSRVKRPKREDIPADEEIKDQLEEMAEDYDYYDLNYLKIKKR